MIKKNLYFASLFFVCLGVLLGISSTSYAWTIDDFITYSEQLASSDATPTDLKNKALKVVQFKDSIKNSLSGYSTILVQFPGASSGIDFYVSNSTFNNVSFDSSIMRFNQVQFKDCWLSYGNGVVSIGGNINATSFATYQWYGLVELSALQEETIPSNVYLQNRYIQGFEFTPNNNGVVTYNGYQNVNAIKINFFNARTILGRINKLNAECDYYRYVVLDPNGNRIAWLNYHLGDSYYSTENMEMNIETSYVYVDTRLLYVNNIYTLAIYGSKQALFDDISAALDSQVFTYVPLRQNAVISGGAVTNEGSGDNYTSQNSTNDIINNLTDTEDANNTINNFFSGDSSSFANSLGYSPIQNPFVALIQNTLETIINIILGSGNETLTLGMHGNSFVLHSEDFTIPDGSIKTFITLVTNGFLIWAIVKYGFQLYQWINTGRLQNLVNEANGHWYKALF